MKDKWLVTLEIDTYDGNPKNWDWSRLLVNDETKFISSNFQGVVRPLEKEGEGNE